MLSRDQLPPPPPTHLLVKPTGRKPVPSTTKKPVHIEKPVFAPAKPEATITAQTARAPPATKATAHIPPIKTELEEIVSGEAKTEAITTAQKLQAPLSTKPTAHIPPIETKLKQVEPIVSEFPLPLATEPVLSEELLLVPIEFKEGPKYVPVYTSEAIKSALVTPIHAPPVPVPLQAELPKVPATAPLMVEPYVTPKLEHGFATGRRASVIMTEPYPPEYIPELELPPYEFKLYEKVERPTMNEPYPPEYIPEVELGGEGFKYEIVKGVDIKETYTAGYAPELEKPSVATYPYPRPTMSETDLIRLNTFLNLKNNPLDQKG
eukprot:TRINITY_DN176_c0_g1_i14.p1 TRINITY_DN176_c0_g1~~TRINITY_DN176_c0_g1_i14.p1  ORF type:complete len:321 (+),score=33.65 TRINITY_DN176_c0_g1_i14:259-1221(+)